MFTMIRNVVPNHICRYFVANGAAKVSIFPKLSTPKLFFYFRVLLEYYDGTDILQHPYHLGGGVPRRKGQKDMDMVLCDLKGIYLKIVIYGNFLKDLFRSFFEIFSQDPFSLLRCPYQMIFRIIERMRSPFQFHAVDIALYPCLRQEIFSSPFTKRGIQVLGLHKKERLDQ